MPNRVLKESINESRGLTSCTFFAQDLYKRLITYADDYGRFNADPQIMVARLYPRELAVVSLDDLIEGLIELCGAGKIGFYTSQPRHEVYGAFPHWQEHQRLRESKQKVPDPEDTSVNDWYYRRFIPLSMKAAVIERDGFKCKICGRHIAEITDAKKLAKMGFGLFHIDHIVPCNQGGRATMENLRLTCPKCNLSRKKAFSYDDILAFAENGDSPRVAASCGELPQTAASYSELPRVAARARAESESESESKTNPNPNPNAGARTDDGFDTFWTAYPRHTGKQDAQRAWRKLSPDADLQARMLEAVARQKQSAQWTKDGGQFIPHPATWINGRRWEDELPKGGKSVTAQQFPQRTYDEKTLENDVFGEFLSQVGGTE